VRDASWSGIPLPPPPNPPAPPTAPVGSVPSPLGPQAKLVVGGVASSRQLGEGPRGGLGLPPTQLNLRRSRHVRELVAVVADVVPVRLLRPVTRVRVLKARVDLSDTEPTSRGGSKGGGVRAVLPHWALMQLWKVTLNDLIPPGKSPSRARQNARSLATSFCQDVGLKQQIYLLRLRAYFNPQHAIFLLTHKKLLRHSGAANGILWYPVVLMESCGKALHLWHSQRECVASCGMWT
jgi:hypothetical protein